MVQNAVQNIFDFHHYRFESVLFPILVLSAFLIHFTFNSQRKDLPHPPLKEEVGILFALHLFWIFLLTLITSTSPLAALNVGNLNVGERAITSLAAIQRDTVWSDFLIIICQIFIFTALEEFIFRGKLFDRLQSRWGMRALVPLILLNSFIIAKWPLALVSPMIYSWVKVKTHSLWLTWALHSLEYLLFFYSFPVSHGSNWLLYATHQHEMVITFCAILLSVAPMWVFFDLFQSVHWRRRTKKLTN